MLLLGFADLYHRLLLASVGTFVGPGARVLWRLFGWPYPTRGEPGRSPHGDRAALIVVSLALRMATRVPFPTMLAPNPPLK
jgi:hypothetical protein